MKSICFLVVNLCSFTIVFAQKQLQDLKPARLGIFKNGTCFVKREALVPVTEKSFYIKAPDKVLMGTYWVAVGKESSLSSIIVKTDTFKVVHTAKTLADFLEANIGQNITLYGNATNTDLQKLSGKLLAYDVSLQVMKIAANNGKIIIANSYGFDWFESDVNPKSEIKIDSIISIAKIKLNKQVDKILTSTISLEKGVQWFASYLFTVINDKEAKLEMKATIANGETDYLQMPVDIIIGNPEMFYGKKLDPVCIDYLAESLLENKYDYNGFANNLSTSNNFSTSLQMSSKTNGETKTYNWENETEETEGQKLEDLYYYQLGVIDLERNSRVIVSVMTTTVMYYEIYTTDLPLNSPSMEGANSIQTYRSYIINNGTNAPFTSGASLVINQNGQPISQSQINYTPLKGTSELRLSKAVDVQVANTESETARVDAVTKFKRRTYEEKVTNSGIITITNYKDKKIKIRVSKAIEGVFINSDNNGKSKKTISNNYNNSNSNLINWEIEIEPNSTKEIKYSYYILE